MAKLVGFETGMKYLTIARYREDVAWSLTIPTAVCISVYSKAEDQMLTPYFWLPNVGREAHTYLHHIVANYHRLPPEMVFCQGNPFDHDRDFIAHFMDPTHLWFGAISGCPSSGYPHMDDAYLDEHCRVLGLPKQGEYKFAAGAQYRVTAEQIRSRPIEFYECLLALTKLMPRLPYSLERLWPLIWGIKLE
jgi:hypothetical protein